MHAHVYIYIYGVCGVEGLPKESAAAYKSIVSVCSQLCHPHLKKILCQGENSIYLELAIYYKTRGTDWAKKLDVSPAFFCFMSIVLQKGRPYELELGENGMSRWICEKTCQQAEWRLSKQ